MIISEVVSESIILWTERVHQLLKEIKTFRPNQFSQAFSAFYHLIKFSAIFASTQYVTRRLAPSNTRWPYYKER